jgi:hypothetical protein
MTIEDKYTQKCQAPSDINENLPDLKKYAMKYDTITEMGVRAIVSTWALLAGTPKKLTSIDIKHPSEYGGNIDEVSTLAKEAGIEFEFILGDTLIMDIEECDMLFIDTLHFYDHLTKELERHSTKAKHCIAFHDTTSCPEVYQAILDFIAKNPVWRIDLHKENNNGLLFLVKD